MTLGELVSRMTVTWICGGPDTPVTGLAFDSRKAAEGEVFLCIAGARFDSHDAIADVAARGVAAVIISKDPAACGLGPDGVPGFPQTAVLQVADARLAEAELAAAWYGHPADRLKTIGITGSKGKTTCAHMVAGIFEAAGHSVGTIGTNGVTYAGQWFELTNTTPAAHEMQRYLREMADAGVDVAVIECSSQGLMQHRCSGFTFDAGIFMNISHGDHIGPNEHKDFADYLYCKGRLLRHSRHAFVCADDEHAQDVLAGVTAPVTTFGFAEGADYRLASVEKVFAQGAPGLHMAVEGRLQAELDVNLPGTFNAVNALAAVAVADTFGCGTAAMEEGLTHLHIRGRFEIVFKNSRMAVCVDFAHNGYSTRNHLEALREYHPKRLVCVFGADGNRSRDRRYEMGEASGRLADFSIITAGHNRWEPFEVIRDDILTGMHRTDGEYIVIPNRVEAIRYAMENAREGDLITILGLGHEFYQEEKGVMTPYSDKETVLRLAEELKLGE